NIAFFNFPTSSLNGYPDAILAAQNIWTVDNGSGAYVRGNPQPANTFDSDQNTIAGYLSNAFRVADKFRAILGLRAEKFTTHFTGQNTSGSIVYGDEKTIDELDLFPSVNLIYEFRDNTNFRISYSRTTARPSFKEL